MIIFKLLEGIIVQLCFCTDKYLVIYMIKFLIYTEKLAENKQKRVIVIFVFCFVFIMSIDVNHDKKVVSDFSMMLDIKNWTSIYFEYYYGEFKKDKN